MIAARARDLADLVERTYRAEQVLAESESYQATTDALRVLEVQIHSLVNDYWRLAGHLGPSQGIEIQRALQYVRDELERIRGDLRSNPRQSNEIAKLTRRLESTASGLAVSWRTWSQKQIQPHRDALVLVSFLPEIQEQRIAIDFALDRAAELSSSFPKDDETLQMFFKTLKNLEAVLGDIEGISPTIREFLGKVVNNQATFADLNIDILEWIRERGRARAFRIAIQGQRPR